MKMMAFSATTRPEESKVFYRDVLGLPLTADEPWALVFDAHGTMLRVQKAPEHTPAKHTLLGWQVSDIEASMRELSGRGVQFDRYPWMPPSELALWTSPDGARVAWFKDPDGNVLSLTQFP